MKHIFTLAFFALLALVGKAQLYFNFTAQGGAYTPITSTVSGGNATVVTLLPTSTGTGYPPSDEGYGNNIPIGFAFQFDGANHSTINANTNGFATFGNPFFTDASNYDREFYTNSLTNGTPKFSLTTPLLAPLWDDLAITATGSLSYETDGAAPNRVFTLQWSKVQWQNLGTNTPTISFQIKLHETSNTIEFVYNRETGNVSSGATASIGLSAHEIATTVGAGSFISVQSVSANPLVSSTVEAKNINAKPATGQVYRFTPDPCAPPSGLRTSGYNNNSVTYAWNALAGSTGYQVAVDNNTTPPASGTSAGTVTANTQTGLLPDSTYYIHVKNTCGTAWRTIAFKTATTPAAPPFTEGFETNADGEIPANWRLENISTPLDDGQWEGGTDATYAASGSHFLGNYAPWVDADSWAYTSSLLLTAGKQYQVRFKYAIAGGGVHAMQVKMGQKVGKDSMTTLLLSDTNIINDRDNGTPYIDTTILFTPAATGTYYVGFNYNATIANAQGGFMLLDDISVLENIVAPVTLLSFLGEANNNQHLLHWATASEQNNRGFELQQSADGSEFKPLVWVASLAPSGNSHARLSYTFANARLLPGTNYYRLKQMDNDGEYTLSPIVKLENKGKAFLAVSIYPNPVTEAANVVINTTTAQAVQLTLFSVEGKMIWARKQTLQAGQQSISIPMKTFPGASYRLMVQGEGGDKTSVTIIKQ